MKNQTSCLLAPALFTWCFALSFLPTAPAATIVWTNANGGLWSVATNWSSGSVPGVSDAVSITAAGNYTVTQDVQITIASLTLGGGSGTQILTNAGANLTLNGASTVNGNGVLGIGGGTLAGSAALTVGGKVIWTGGTIGGEITVIVNGTLEMRGAGVKALSGAGTLRNYGTITWSGSNDLQTANSARIVNQPGALFDIQNNQVLAIYNGGAITNLGTIRKSAGGGLTIITVPLYNTGTLDVQSGIIGYGASVGSQFNAGTAFTGTGTNLIYNGTVTFDGAIASENLELGGATLGGNGVFSGTVNWSSGTLSSGALTIATNGTLRIGGVTEKHMNGAGTLVNYGTITWSGSNDLQTANSARIINQPGALFDIQNNQVLAIYNGGAITNLGTIRKSAGGGLTIITVPLYNAGTLDVQSGIIGYGASVGNQFNAGTAFTGSGTNLIYAGTITFDGPIASENLELGGATLGGNGVFSGIVNWSSGTLSSGALTIATNGTLHIGGVTEKHLNGAGTLVNYGTITWSGSNDLQTANSARIVNHPGALFDIQNNQVLAIYNGGAITNLGTIRKSAGGGLTIITVPLYNAGTLDVQSGIIGYGASVGNQFNAGTAFTGTGTNLIYNGAVTFDGAIASENLELGGATLGGNGVFSGTVNWSSGNLSTGVLTIATNGALRISGSVKKNLSGASMLINHGTITWSGSNDLQTFNDARIINQPGALFDIQNNQVLDIWNGGAITNLGVWRKSGGDGNTLITVPLRNAGTVDVQSGKITFSTYTQNGGKLSFGLNSLTNFGRIAFANSVTLEGTLAVNFNEGYAPVAGDAFALLTFPSRTGTFASFDLPASHAWQTNSTIYSATAVTLTVLNARPLLTPLATQTGDEQTPITFTASVSHPDPAQTLTFSLLAPPAGATINATNGNFSWTPSEAQGPSTNTFSVLASDDGTPALAHTQQVTIAVNEVNRPPVPTPLTLPVINELEPFLLATNLATDPDIPANTLTFALITSPSGMTINENSGAISWTPTEMHGPATNPISVRITDHGSPSLAATNTFTLTVAEVNSAPTLASLANCTHVAGAMHWITNSASDDDWPPQSLTYSLVNAPPGMNIGPTSGWMVWAPPATCAPLTNSVTVRVTDSGSPPLLKEQSFTATLIAPPRLRIEAAGAGLVVLAWPGNAAAAGFVLQSTTQLLATASWTNVPGIPTLLGGENRLTNSANSSFRAYRLAAPRPPLPSLRIAMSATNSVVVIWPANAGGFVLQTAPAMTSPRWADATNTVAVNGESSFITEPMSGRERYYRLRLMDLP